MSSDNDENMKIIRLQQEIDFAKIDTLELKTRLDESLENERNLVRS